MIVAAAAVLAVMAVFLYLSADRLSLHRHDVSVGPVAMVDSKTIGDKSIAVLPFVDISEKKDQEYFADGMAEEVLDLLTKVPGIRVIGRTSSFQFKGRSEDLRSVGRTLGAAYIVEGSVRKAGDRLRVTAQLVGAGDGSHQWSHTYDEDFGDVLVIQDRIAAVSASRGRCRRSSGAADAQERRGLRSLSPRTA